MRSITLNMMGNHAGASFYPSAEKQTYLHSIGFKPEGRSGLWTGKFPVEEGGATPAPKPDLSASVKAVTPEKVTVDELARRKAANPKRPPTITPQLLQEAGHELTDAFGREPSGNAWDPHKVMISELYDNLAPKLGGMPLDQFKRQLLEMNQRHEINLSRIDLVPSLTDDRRQHNDRGAIRHMNAEFNAVALPSMKKEAAAQRTEAPASPRDRYRNDTPAADLLPKQRRALDAEIARLGTEQASLEKQAADHLAIINSPRRDDETRATHMDKLNALKDKLAILAEHRQGIDDYAHGRLKPAAEEVADWIDRQSADGTPEELVQRALSKNVKLPPDVRHQFADVVKAHQEAKKAQADETKAGLETIPEGQTGYVGGWFLRRTGKDRWRLETDKTSRADKGYVEGNADTIAAHIQDQHQIARMQGRRVEEALDRFKNAPAAQLASGGGLFGGEELAGQAGFGKLPNGARILVTEGGYTGRVGSLIHETDESGRVSAKVKLDGSPEPVNLRHSAVEPLDPRQSWRSPEGWEPKAKQAGLFGGGGAAETLAEAPAAEETFLPPSFRPESPAHQQALSRLQSAQEGHQGDAPSDKRLEHAKEMFKATVGGEAPKFLGKSFDRAEYWREEDACKYAEEDWQFEEGPRGGKRWRNIKTGKIVYSPMNPGAGASGEAAKRKPDDEHMGRIEKTRTRISEALQASGLSRDKAAEYASGCDFVIRNMTPAASARHVANTTGYVFYPSHQALTEGFLRKFPKAAKQIKGRLKAAFDRDGVLHLDGGGDLFGIETPVSEFYAHEITHSIDGVSREISSSPEWIAAWEKEIVGNELLGRKAKASPSEGFAALGQQLFGSQTMSRGDIRDVFPECVKVWERNSL